MKYNIPKNLYIPPGALEIVLETFEGPLDLLLYLIKKQNLDILNIPMTLITQQYIGYIAVLEKARFELAAEYLVMAAMLMEIKSCLLLPANPLFSDAVEEDPRMELVRRLLDYERYKKAALTLDNYLRQERDFFSISGKCPVLPETVRPLASVTLQELLNAFQGLQEHLNQHQHHQIQREQLTVSDRIGHILERLRTNQTIQFHGLLLYYEGRAGIVVTLMALLELAKQSVIELNQGAPFEPIYIRRR